jgi:hypothetical protein
VSTVSRMSITSLPVLIFAQRACREPETFADVLGAEGQRDGVGSGQPSDGPVRHGRQDQRNDDSAQ